MLHPHTELRFVNEVIGYGVFATQFIPKGTITWVRDELDRIFTPEQVARLRDPYARIIGRYGYLDRHGGTIFCWDHARFMNHSCQATCLSAGYDFEICLRDVEAGEELTDDYGTLNLEETFECACGKPNCRGQIMPDDISRLADDWDARLRLLFPLIPQLEQPLWPLVHEKELVELAAAQPAHMRSCRWHQFNAPAELRAG